MPGKLLCGLKTLLILGDLVSEHSLSQNNVTLIFMTSSNNEFTHLHMKTQRQIFVLVSGGHICAQRHTNMPSLYQSLIEGDMGVYGIAVMSFFSSGILVILILMCGITVSSSPPVCGFSSFWLTVFGKRSFTVLQYRSFGLSCLMQVNIWKTHIKYKISHIKYRTDLILGKAFRICIFLHFSRFGAFSIEWLAFLFLMA